MPLPFYIGSKKVPVVAGILEDVGRYFRRVPGDRGGCTYVLSALLVESLVEKKVELDVPPWLPKVFDCTEDLEVDANVLFRALREKDGSPHVGRYYFRQ